MIHFSEKEYKMLWEMLPVADDFNRIYYSNGKEGACCKYSQFMEKCKGFDQMARHLGGELNEEIYAMIHEAPLEKMPLEINHPGWGVYAKWRLMMGR